MGQLSAEKRAKLWDAGLDHNIENIKGKEKVTDPLLPYKTQQFLIRHILPNTLVYSFSGTERTGRAILLIMPTQNNDKCKVIANGFQYSLNKASQTDRKVIQVRYNDNSGVGGQPYYNEAGLKGACGRIKNVLAENKDKIEATIEEYNDLQTNPEAKIGTVIVGSIENFIQLMTNGNPRPDVIGGVDYGAIVFFNAATAQYRVCFSRGVTVPLTYLLKARSFGHVLGEENHGLVTLGEVLEANFDMVEVLVKDKATGGTMKVMKPQVENADWHKVVTPIMRGKRTSRFELLEEGVMGLLTGTLHYLLPLLPKISEQKQKKDLSQTPQDRRGAIQQPGARTVGQDTRTPKGGWRWGSWGR